MLTWEDAAKLSIPAAVAIAGWYAQFRLNQKAQLRSLRLQAMDRARVDLVKSLRAYQAWLTKGASRASVSITFMEIVERDDDLWSETAQDLARWLHDSDAESDWLHRLAEYEVLFPSTRNVKSALLMRHRLVWTDMSRLEASLSRAAREHTPLPERSEFQRLYEGAYRLSFLIGDLIVHIQNFALAELMDKPMPLRVPSDRTAERIELNQEGGQLEIRMTSEFDERRKARPLFVASKDG